MFPNNGSYIRITFYSDGNNGRPYRGFNADIQQLPNSCFYPFNGIARIGNNNNNTNNYPYNNNGTLPQQQVIHSIYGQRIYPSTIITNITPPTPKFTGITAPNTPSVIYHYDNGTKNSPYPKAYPPYMVGTSTDYGVKIQSFNPQIPYQPSTISYNPSYPLSPQAPNLSLQPQLVVGYKGSHPDGEGWPPKKYYNTSALSPSLVYLASYCDVFLGEMIGELRSPGYPFGYPINHSCIYTVKRYEGIETILDLYFYFYLSSAYDDVCQLELIFHHLDIVHQQLLGGASQPPGIIDQSKRDLTDQCIGDYLELPDHTRLCGYYNQAMSREHVLKRFYLFPDQSDYLFLQFFSDSYSSPDGSGFWIEARQLRNTCNTAASISTSKSSSYGKCFYLMKI